MTVRVCLDCGARVMRTERGRCGACARLRHSTAYGAAYRRRRAPLMGQPCELRLPGCLGIATTADHVVPVAHGGAHGALRPACAPCNRKRSDAVGGYRHGGGEGSGRVVDAPRQNLRPFSRRKLA